VEVSGPLVPDARLAAWASPPGADFAAVALVSFINIRSPDDGQDGSGTLNQVSTCASIQSIHSTRLPSGVQDRPPESALATGACGTAALTRD